MDLHFQLIRCIHSSGEVTLCGGRGERGRGGSMTMLITVRCIPKYYAWNVPRHMRVAGELEACTLAMDYCSVSL